MGRGRERHRKSSEIIWPAGQTIRNDVLGSFGVCYRTPRKEIGELLCPAQLTGTQIRLSEEVSQRFVVCTNHKRGSRQVVTPMPYCFNNSKHFPVRSRVILLCRIELPAKESNRVEMLFFLALL